MEKQPTDLMLVEELPALVVARATDQARALMDIVNKQKLYQEIQGKKYLQVEAWEVIGAFNKIAAVTDYILSEERDNVIVGYEAGVSLWRNNIKVGGAIMSCGLDEFPCRGKEGEAKHKAAKSAAQTWATSKAYRMNFSWVAVLAGYQPTPAEEMGDIQVKAREQDSKSKRHWCQKHETVFFKKGTMKNYAHPIKDSDAWCNEAETNGKLIKAIETEESPDIVVDKSIGTELEVISFESIRPALTKLHASKTLSLKGEGWSMDSILKKLADLGADITSQKVQLSFETLNNKGKQDFVDLVNKASEP